MKFPHQLLGAAALSLFAAMASGQTYPDRELSGVIQWGAGGATDVAARSLTPYAEEALGKKIVLQNKAGGVGAIATNYVMQQPGDGYTVLFGAENPQLHPVLGISTLDYSKFYPVNIVARGKVLVVTTPNKPWKTFKDLLAEVQANPGKVKQGSTGTGGLPFTVSSMISTVTKFTAPA
ncbi:MAG: tripartite tricarboxylate transporter substrate-binding protein [Polaromonas sp.]